MSIIVKTVTRWVVAFIFVYGVNIVVYGHLTPGGGFAGGVILACAFALLVLAWGKNRSFEILPYGAAKSFDSAGAIAFLVIALLGILSVQGVFFSNFIQKSVPGTPLRIFNGGIVPLCNVGIAIKVCASLFLAVVALSALRVVSGGKDSEFSSQEE